MALEPVRQQRDAYTDPKEVIWKHLMAGMYRQIIQKLNDAALLDDPVIHELHVRTIDTFNGNHDKRLFNERLNTIQKELILRLNSLNQQTLVGSIKIVIKESRASVVKVLKSLEKAESNLAHHDQTHISDGIITIAGKSLEDFSRASNYFSGTLQLVGSDSDQYRVVAEAAYRKGVELGKDDKDLLDTAKREKWDMPEVITSLLVAEQNRNRNKSVQGYEWKPNATEAENIARRTRALSESYYLMGKIITSIAYIASPTFNPHVTSSDPVAAFLQHSGFTPNDGQIAAVKRVALAHSSHGLNSGELTARLAGSVRTSFPRALIASFNIRSGILHSGAVKECMEQTRRFLESDTDPEAYVRGTIERGEKLYGFGHRIHKTEKTDPTSMLGKDPRVALYIQAVREGFPEKVRIINRMVAYAEAVRKIRPNLGANTDFGAAVLFHSLELSPQIAEGFFAAFRCAGVCAQVVNELSVKGNSRRPPFPEVLPYQRSKQ